MKQFRHIFATGLLLAAGICPADSVPVPVVVAGQSFPCHFENGSLSAETKAAIAADLAALWANWPDSTVEVGEENGFKGKLATPHNWQSPYLSGKEVPAWLCGEGTNLALHVSATVSSDYATALSLAGTMTNEFSALSVFVASLSPSSLSNAAPAELSTLLHGYGSVTAENRDRIVSELLETRFHTPSLLGVGFAPKATGIIPAGTLVAGIPCLSADAPVPFFAIWPAAWLDGRWGLLPLY